MYQAWFVLAAILVVSVPTTAEAGNGKGNGADVGYNDGNSSDHDQGAKQDGAKDDGSEQDGAGSNGDDGSGPGTASGAGVLSPEGAASSSDQNVALDAVESGEALPLTDIARRVRDLFSARVLDAQLIQRKAGLIYRLTILTDAGISKRVDIDAKAGTVVSVH